MSRPTPCRLCRRPGCRYSPEKRPDGEEPFTPSGRIVPKTPRLRKGFFLGTPKIRYESIRLTSVAAKLADGSPAGANPAVAVVGSFAGGGGGGDGGA